MVYSVRWKTLLLGRQEVAVRSVSESNVLLVARLDTGHPGCGNVMCARITSCESCYVNGSLEGCEVVSAPPQGHKHDHDMSLHVKIFECDGCDSIPISVEPTLVLHRVR